MHPMSTLVRDLPEQLHSAIFSWVATPSTHAPFLNLFDSLHQLTRAGLLRHVPASVRSAQYVGASLIATPPLRAAYASSFGFAFASSHPVALPPVLPQISALDWFNGAPIAAGLAGAFDLCGSVAANTTEASVCLDMRLKLECVVVAAPVTAIDGLCLHLDSTARLKLVWHCLRVRCTALHPSPFSAKTIPISNQRTRQALDDVGRAYHDSVAPSSAYSIAEANVAAVDAAMQSFAVQTSRHRHGLWMYIKEFMRESAWSLEPLPPDFSFKTQKAHAALARLDRTQLPADISSSSSSSSPSPTASTSAVVPLRPLIETALELDVSAFHIAQLFARRRYRGMHDLQCEWETYNTLVGFAVRS
jgi:hypothetical protein